MSYIISLDAVGPEDKPFIGGKAFTLSLLSRQGMTVPRGAVITVEAYRAFVSTTGLAERIHMELGRKRFEDMRWEEIWDAALRIRNMFLKAPMPVFIKEALEESLSPGLTSKALAVRSSAPGEDAEGSSFAGLHDSFVNVRGMNSVIASVRKVWASLWSDAALMYRKELNLDIETSAMAVLIQEVVLGESSGVVFCRNPNDPNQAVLESVHGLNEGLVDGRVEPDRWILGLAEGRILSHSAPERQFAVAAGPDGTFLEPLPREKTARPPLTDQEVLRVFEMAIRAETVLKYPQDVEWTIFDGSVYLLQARPITTLGETGGDLRPWYLSLRRSFSNLKSLRLRIEQEILPGMASAADHMGMVRTEGMSDDELASEIKARREVLDEWTAVYWEECIPFAHGVRLFGHVYNDTVQPADPFEFVAVLGSEEMLSVARNRALKDLADLVGKDTELEVALRKGKRSGLAPSFEQGLKGYLDRYGELSCHEHSCTRDTEDVIALVLKLAAVARGTHTDKEPKDRSAMEKRFLSAYGDERRDEALELLDLARASYRLRDDDNLYLGRIEGEVLRAVQEGRNRLRPRFGDAADGFTALEAAEGLINPNFEAPERTKDSLDDPGLPIAPRQLTGQPAGPGLVSGKARVILGPADLRALEAGEVLVCDAVDPNMTSVVPLAAAIVERRGGMLIHGAIIAREYGLPCVTGVPKATTLLRTGEMITVDGYLGIVTVNRETETDL